jgi:predicted transcriptional regulator
MGIEYTILMSLRKEPFEAIIEGEKQHEFRRKYGLKESHTALIYVPSPVKEIQGIITFGPIIKDSVERLATIGRNHKYKGDQNIANYMKGLDEGYALPVIEAKKLENSVTLNELREIIPKFSPPQSYFGINNPKYNKIVEYIMKKNGI